MSQVVGHGSVNPITSILVSHPVPVLAVTVTSVPNGISIILEPLTVPALDVIVPLLEVRLIT